VYDEAVSQSDLPISGKAPPAIRRKAFTSATASFG
jgi:hypothetical protein